MIFTIVLTRFKVLLPKVRVPECTLRLLFFRLRFFIDFNLLSNISLGCISILLDQLFREYLLFAEYITFALAIRNLI